MAQVFFKMAAAFELLQALWHIVRGLLLVVLLAATVHAAAIQQPTGYYVMQAVHNQNVSDNVISDSKLSGFHLRDSWDLLEPQRGTFDYSWYDQQLARAARVGKHVTLGLYSGAANDPSWGNSLADFQSAVAALGARYGTNPLVDAVHLSSPQVTDNSMEMFLPSSWGGTDAAAITLWERSIDAYNAAFPNKVLVLDVAIAGSSGAITKGADEYARTVLGARFNAIICSLKATTQTNAPHIVELSRLHSEGVRIGFEFVGPSIDAARFGGTFTSALALGKQLGGQWFQPYQQDVQYLPNSPTPEPSTLAYVAIFVGLIFVAGSRRRAWR